MIAIIDYGAGNIFSVKNALDYLELECKLTSDINEIKAADALILPGVGAFPAAMNMLEKSGLSSFDELHGEQYLTDPQVTEIVTYVIKELDEEGKISCKCGDGAEGEYDAEIQKDGINVICKRCGASKFLPTNSLISANEFLNADSLELE